MICPRRFWRPRGGVDVPALASGVVFLAATAWLAWRSSGAWRELFPGAALAIPASMLSVPFWTPQGRRLAWFLWWSLAGWASPPHEDQAEVLLSEAERHRVHSGDESDLDPSARYVVRLWTSTGQCMDVELPLRRWARLRVGEMVRVAWKGGWVTALDEQPGGSQSAS